MTTRTVGGISFCSLLAILGYSHDAHALEPCPPRPSGSCGLFVSPPSPQVAEGWFFIRDEDTAVMSDPTSSGLSIYMDDLGRPVLVNTLTVSGTNMAGYYVNGSIGGTANINFENGAIADLIEAGGAASDPATNVNIVVDGSELNGAQTDRIYDIANGGNKNFTLGSAIFIDLADRGDHVISIINGSRLHGSIVTGTTGVDVRQDITVSGSSIDNGGIYVAGFGANRVSVSNSTVDATNSQVADSLVDFAQEVAAAYPGTTIDVSGLDNLAIGMMGTAENSLSVAGSTIIGDVGILGGTSEMSVTDGSLIEGNLTMRGGGVANVTFDNSTIVGAIRTGAGSTSNLTLIDSTWNLTGNSNVTNLTNDPSLIDFAPPVGDPTLLSSYKTLTATNYVGEGGRIALNTFLAGEGPSDRLVIDGGTATGTTSLIARDTGGGGALKTGNGILVVDAVNGGTTAPGAFTGFGAAGPYEYLLERGGAAPGTENDWFLRDTIQGPSGPIPIFRQEVSLYVAMPAMASIYGRKLIDTLHERMGGDAQLLGPDKANMPDGAWGRLIGYGGNRDGDPVGIYGSRGPEYDYDFAALQTGLDLYRSEHADGQHDNAGLYFATGHADADVQHTFRGNTFKAGDDRFDAVSVGGYWTRFGKNGWYLDGVVQGTWYNMDMTAHRGLHDGDTNAFGFAASLEGGYPFQLGDGWQLEPQTQLVYQALNIDDFNDGAATVRYSDTNSLAGRIGARVTRDWEVGSEASKRRFTLWGRADLWHDFLDDPTTEFSSAAGFIPFTPDLGNDWATLGLGASMQIGKSTSLYGNVNYDVSFNGGADAWEGKVGLKVQW